MNRFLKTYRLSLATALVAGAILFALPFEYCMAGNGYGLPFPWYHPNHGEPGEIPIGSGDMAIDTANLLSAAVLWTIAVAIQAARERGKSRARSGTDN